LDSLTFIAELVKALAWPATIVTAIALLRRSLLQLIPGLQKFKYKDLEVEFEKQLEAAKAEVAGSNVLNVSVEHEAKFDQGMPRSESILEDSIHLPNMMQNIERIAVVSPRAAIAEAWRFVDLAAHRAIKNEGLSRPRNPQANEKVLTEIGILPDNLKALYSDLRSMRNSAVHALDMDLTPGQAIEYAMLTAVLITVIAPKVIPLSR
jgi:hypothetical protein